MSLESELARHTALIEAQCRGLEVHGAVMGRLSSALEKMFSAAVRSAKPSESPASAPEEASALAEQPAEGETTAETAPRRGRPAKTGQEAKAKAELEAAAKSEPTGRTSEVNTAWAKAAEGSLSKHGSEAAAGSMDQAAFRAEIRKYLASCARNHFDAAVSKIKAELSLRASTKIMDIAPEHFGKVLWAFGETKAGRQFSFEVFDGAVQGAGASEDEEI